MNYRRVYDALIAKRRAVPPVGYSERHHVIPRALGGSEAAENLVRLTGREHFVAHVLLARLYGGTMWLAVIRMKGRRHGGGYVNGRLYGEARASWAQWSSENQRGQNHWAFGTQSPLRGVKRPEFTGPKHPRFGVKLTAEQLAAVVAANTGRKRSAETRMRIGAAQLGEKNHAYGKPLSAEHRAKVGAAMARRTLTDAHKANIGASRLGKTHSEESKAKMRAAKARRREAQT